MKQDMIAVIDLGSTRNTDVARAIRALGVYSVILPRRSFLRCPMSAAS